MSNWVWWPTCIRYTLTPWELRHMSNWEWWPTGRRYTLTHWAIRLLNGLTGPTWLFSYIFTNLRINYYNLSKTAHSNNKGMVYCFSWILGISLETWWSQIFTIFLTYTSLNYTVLFIFLKQTFVLCSNHVNWQCSLTVGLKIG